MSEKDVRENALRKGRLACQDGRLLSDNPMQSASSKLWWEKGWIDERRIADLDDKIRSR